MQKIVFVFVYNCPSSTFKSLSARWVVELLKKRKKEKTTKLAKSENWGLRPIPPKQQRPWFSYLLNQQVAWTHTTSFIIHTDSYIVRWKCNTCMKGVKIIILSTYTVGAYQHYGVSTGSSLDCKSNEDCNCMKTTWSVTTQQQMARLAMTLHFAVGRMSLIWKN